MSRAEELIADLEAEIVRRDARIEEQAREIERIESERAEQWRIRRDAVADIDTKSAIIAELLAKIEEQRREVGLITIERNRLINSPNNVFKKMCDIALKQRDDLAAELAAMKSQTSGVVLPERKCWLRPSAPSDFERGHDYALDEVARLNSPHVSAGVVDSCTVAGVSKCGRSGCKETANWLFPAECDNHHSETLSVRMGVPCKTSTQPATDYGRAGFESCYHLFDLSRDTLSGAYILSDVRTLWDAWKARAAQPDHGAQSLKAGQGEAVAFLDIGAGGYVDLGTDQTIDALEKLPYGRHMLGIIGTYGADGWHPAAQRPLPDAEPVAYAAFAENGNIRVWSRGPGVVETIAAQGCKAVPLYTSPPSAPGTVPVRPEKQELEWLENWLKFAADPIGQECCNRPGVECCGCPDVCYPDIEHVGRAMDERAKELRALLAQSEGVKS